MKFISSLIFTGCADGSGGPTCCTSSRQCGEGEGDCDSDVDCAGNLKCGQGNGLDDNCNTSLGFPSSYDCCYDPGKAVEGLFLILVFLLMLILLLVFCLGSSHEPPTDPQGPDGTIFKYNLLDPFPKGRLGAFNTKDWAPGTVYIL